jgi:HPt (histidine-containing phosphotransfer) domain-containing protein
MLDRQLRAEPVPPVLNHDYLAGLRRHLGTAHTGELLADGVLDLAGRLDRLAEMARQRDNPAIARLTHEIVGLAGYLGLQRMSQFAAQASHAARQGDPAVWVDALLDSQSASIGMLRAYCDACLDESAA